MGCFRTHVWCKCWVRISWLCADADQGAVPEVLGADWAGVPPDKVLATQAFFVDVMRNAPALELTVCASPAPYGGTAP